MSGDDVQVAFSLFQESRGGAVPTSPHQLEFKPIKYHTAMNVVVKNHYLHRKSPATWCFGAYFERELLGVCVIGKPASYTATKGVCGENKKSDVYELNRLWLDDVCPKNSESRFIGWVLRQLPKGTVLISYADTDQNHIGIIYRATNWVYTGLSDKHTIPVGNTHPRHLATGGKNYKERSRKHRYVYFTDTKDKELLRWNIAGVKL